MAGFSFRNGVEGIDTYFPLKIWFISLFCGVSGAGLLLKSHELASLLAKDDAMVEWLTRFLYFRGWFVLSSMSVGLYAYIKNWHPSLVFSVLVSVGAVNLVSDLFMVYPEHLNHSTPMLAISLLIRTIALACLVHCAKNADRIPATADRLNILLHLKNHHAQ